MDASSMRMIAIIVIITLLCIIARMALLYIRDRRINDFTIAENDVKDIYDNLFMKFILSFSKVLKEMVIFNGVAHSYDKYVNEESVFKKGIDYIALKIILSILLGLIYLISSMLYIKDINLIILLVFFIIGLIIPDMYLLFKNGKKAKITNNDILKVVIIMNNSFKANRNSEQALKDAISRTNGGLKDELKIVLKDVKLGLSYSNSFSRMKNRVDLCVLDELVNGFKLHEIAGIGLVEIFTLLENKIVNEEKINSEVKHLRRYNIFSYVFFAVLPLVFISLLVVANSNYYDLVMSKKGIVIIVCELLIYIIYLLIIMFIEKGHKYE